MRRRKSHEILKYLAVAILAAAATAFFFLYHKAGPAPLSGRQQAEKQQTGYKEEDRQRLERLIHDGGKDD